MSFILIEQYSISGRIVDHNFNPIEDFKIEVYKEGSSALLQKLEIHSENGEFVIKHLRPDKYEIKIIVEKYTRYTKITEILNKNVSLGEIFLQNSW